MEGELCEELLMFYERVSFMVKSVFWFRESHDCVCLGVSGVGYVSDIMVFCRSSSVGWLFSRIHRLLRCVGYYGGR